MPNLILEMKRKRFRVSVLWTLWPVQDHTPCIVFRHLPQGSATARTGYTTEGALFISVQLSTDAVSALQKVWVPILVIGLWQQYSIQAHK